MVYVVCSQFEIVPDDDSMVFRSRFLAECHSQLLRALNQTRCTNQPCITHLFQLEHFRHLIQLEHIRHLFQLEHIRHLIQLEHITHLFQLEHIRHLIQLEHIRHLFQLEHSHLNEHDDRN